MMFVLIAHIAIGGADFSVLQIKDRMFLRQDACEAAKAQLLYDDILAGRPNLDLECRRMGVVE
jgi:hypothetical protein